MTALSTAALRALSHDQLVWEQGLRAGREAAYLCETHKEAVARSPYLVDGQDPTWLMLERIAETEEQSWGDGYTAPDPPKEQHHDPKFPHPDRRRR